MSDKTPDYQSIEDAYTAPARILDALPKSGLRERAEQLLTQSRDYAYELREKTRDQEDTPHE